MKLTRRAFVKGAAAGAGGLAATRLFVKGHEGRGTAATAAPAPVEEWVPTTCWIGKQDCGMLARRIDGRVVKFEGNPSHPRNAGTLCPKGMAQIIALYDPNRVKTPLLRTNEKGVPGTFTRISWDEALERVAQEIRSVRERDPAAVLWQKGRSKSKEIYDYALTYALGAT